MITFISNFICTLDSRFKDIERCVPTIGRVFKNCEFHINYNTDINYEKVHKIYKDNLPKLHFYNDKEQDFGVTLLRLAEKVKTPYTFWCTEDYEVRDNYTIEEFDKMMEEIVENDVDFVNLTKIGKMTTFDVIEKYEREGKYGYFYKGPQSPTPFMSGTCVVKTDFLIDLIKDYNKNKDKIRVGQFKYAWWARDRMPHFMEAYLSDTHPSGRPIWSMTDLKCYVPKDHWFYHLEEEYVGELRNRMREKSLAEYKILEHDLDRIRNSSKDEKEDVMEDIFRKYGMGEIDLDKGVIVSDPNSTYMKKQINVDMVNVDKKYVIGTHVMFYEIEILNEFVNSIIYATENILNQKNVIVDFFFNMSQYMEEIDEEQISRDELKRRFVYQMELLERCGLDVRYEIYEDDDEFYNVGPYRRDLNYKYCTITDFVIWGETDCLLPKQTFEAIEQISKYAEGVGVHRYCVTFATRKMWDKSWEVLEHTDFKYSEYHEMHEPEKWKNDKSSIWYTMSWEEMEDINKKAMEFDLSGINYPRFDGSGLVISSQLIQNGINLPHACWMVGEDTSFQEMIKKVMGDQYMQYIVNNILKVHNRVHPLKREYVKGESHLPNVKEKRKSNKVYKEIEKMMQHNLSNLGTLQTKFYGRDDFKKIKEK